MDSPLLSSSKIKNASIEVLLERMRTLIALQQQHDSDSSSQHHRQQQQLSKLIKQYHFKQNSNDHEEENIDEDDDDEEQKDDDVVVWKWNNSDSSNDDEDEEGETDYLDLDDDDNDDDDPSSHQKRNNTFSLRDDDDNDDLHHQEQIVNFLRYQCGFLNKRHVMFACAGVNPDVREVEMWLESALNNNHHQKNQELESILFQRYHGLFLHHEQTRHQEEVRKQKRTASSSSSSTKTRSNTPEPSQHQNRSHQLNNKNETSSTSTVSSLPLSGLISQLTVTNFSYITATSLLSLPRLFLPSSSSSPSLISIPELVEFEHAEEIICTRIYQDLLKRRSISPQEALQLCWKIFEEAIDSCAPSRIICSSIICADRILAYIISHPKLSQSRVAEQAVVLLLKMFHDVVPKWNFVQASPTVVVANLMNSTGGGGGGTSSSSSSGLVEHVFHIMINFFTGGSGRRVLQILDSEAGDPDAFVLSERWRNGAHVFALMSLRKIYHHHRTSSQGQQEQQQNVVTSVNFRAFLDLVE